MTSVLLPYNWTLHGVKGSREVVAYRSKRGIGLAPTTVLCEWLDGYGQSLVSIEEKKKPNAWGRWGSHTEFSDLEGLIFNFAAIEEAVLFKLTWG